MKKVLFFLTFFLSLSYSLLCDDLNTDNPKNKTKIKRPLNLPIHENLESSNEIQLYLSFGYNTEIASVERDSFQRFFLKRLLLTRQFDVHLSDYEVSGQIHTSRDHTLFRADVQVSKVKNAQFLVFLKTKVIQNNLVKEYSHKKTCSLKKLYDDCTFSLVKKLIDYKKQLKK